MTDSMLKRFDGWVQRLDERLRDKNFWFAAQMEQLEQSTGLKRSHIALGVIALISLYLMIGYGADLLCNLIGFAYPAYASVKAIESVNKEDDTQWLTYWVVFSVFSIAEFFIDLLLSWIPLYFFLKCLFLIYCMLPVSWNGSNTIYNRLIRPFVLRHQKEIDTAIDEAVGVTRSAVKGVEDLARDRIPGWSLDCMKEPSRSDLR